MESTSPFTREIADFLRTLAEIEVPPVSIEMPFSYFFFSTQRLIIHCVPFNQGLTKILPDTFVSVSDAWAAMGIKVVHIWEDVWRAKKGVVQSRLRSLFGLSYRIPARLTEVRRIDKPTLDAFLEINHLQVSTTAKYKYGLFLPQRYFRVLEKWAEKPDLSLLRPEPSSLLVAVASFSGGKNIPRNAQTYRSFELIRFANVLDATVVGGLDKLLKAFIKEVHPDDIMTYADRDWSNGQSYERLGFERLGTTPPQAFLVNPETFEREYTTPESKLENAVKVYNSGNIKYLLDLLKNPK